MVFPLRADGGGTATEVAEAVVASFGLSDSLGRPRADCPSGAVEVVVVVGLAPNKLVTGAAGAVVVVFAPNKLAGGVDAAGVVAAGVAGFTPKRPGAGSDVLASFLSAEVSLFPKRLKVVGVVLCI